MNQTTLEQKVSRPQADSPLQRLTACVDGLPALPLMATRLLEAVDDPNTTAADIANLISADPALATRLLKMANSAFYGFPRRIGTVNHAIVVLGFETVRDLSLAVLITDCFFHAEEALPFNLEEFWKHSLTAAVSGRMIFRLCGVANPGEGFISGLVHDIGKLLLGRYFTQDYRQVIDRVVQESVPLLEAEQQAFGAGHPQIGAWLLDEWNLPHWLVEAVRNHHGGATSSDSSRLAYAVGFSDLLIRQAHFAGGSPGAETQVTSAMIESLKLKKDVYGNPDYNHYMEKLRRELLRSEELIEAIQPSPTPTPA